MPKQTAGRALRSTSKRTQTHHLYFNISLQFTALYCTQDRQRQVTCANLLLHVVFLSAHLLLDIPVWLLAFGLLFQESFDSPLVTVSLITVSVFLRFL